MRYSKLRLVILAVGPGGVWMQRRCPRWDNQYYKSFCMCNFWWPCCPGCQLLVVRQNLSEMITGFLYCVQVWNTVGLLSVNQNPFHDTLPIDKTDKKKKFDLIKQSSPNNSPFKNPLQGYNALKYKSCSNFSRAPYLWHTTNEITMNLWNLREKKSNILLQRIPKAKIEKK